MTEIATPEPIVVTPARADQRAAPITVASSLQQQLQAARKRAQGRKFQDFEIPGYGGRLWGTFRALDEYSEVRQIVKDNERASDDAEQELLIAADSIAHACTNLYALIDGERTPLDVPDAGMNPATVAYLCTEPYTKPNGTSGERPMTVDNGRQSVLAIFLTTKSVVEFYAKLEQHFSGAGIQTDEDLAGNSAAPS